MGRVIQFLDDITFWNRQLDYFRNLSQRNPYLKPCHEVIVQLKHIIKEEKKLYRRLYGEAFSMRTVDARVLIDYIKQMPYKPNGWEDKFMADVYKQEWKLTSKQKECLTRIYEKASGQGQYEQHQIIG